MEGRNEIVLFETKDKAICLPVPIDRDTVWLTQDQMSELFDTARSSIAYHISFIDVGVSESVINLYRIWNLMKRRKET